MIVMKQFRLRGQQQKVMAINNINIQNSEWLISFQITEMHLRCRLWAFVLVAEFASKLILTQKHYFEHAVTRSAALFSKPRHYSCDVRALEFT